jgi:hypothetical protein
VFGIEKKSIFGVRHEKIPCQTPNEGKNGTSFDDFSKIFVYSQNKYSCSLLFKHFITYHRGEQRAKDRKNQCCGSKFAESGSDLFSQSADPDPDPGPEDHISKKFPNFISPLIFPPFVL